ncbi:hypothetical protein NL676_030835 [Syzygium grande]|nr:hypothetical protein NL676_030835 [Syzygium grande]
MVESYHISRVAVKCSGDWSIKGTKHSRCRILVFFIAQRPKRLGLNCLKLIPVSCIHPWNKSNAHGAPGKVHNSTEKQPTLDCFGFDGPSPGSNHQPHTAVVGAAVEVLIEFGKY